VSRGNFRFRDAGVGILGPFQIPSGGGLRDATSGSSSCSIFYRTELPDVRY
jgi:hypothetical protein